MISYIAVNTIFSIRAAMYNLVLLVILGLVPLKEPDWGIMIYMGRQQGALFNPNAASMLTRADYRDCVVPVVSGAVHALTRRNLQPASAERCMTISDQVVLKVRDLDVSYAARRGRVRAVTDVSFDLHAGETLAFIGESGCGKSTLNLALMRLLPKTGSIDRGSIIYTTRDGGTVDILSLGTTPLRHFRWSECSMVFQGALNALNPVIRVSSMIYNIANAHGMPKDEARKRAFELFERVKLDPPRVFKAYPHELSGGMRQRVLLATACCCVRRSSSWTSRPPPSIF